MERTGRRITRGLGIAAALVLAPASIAAADCPGGTPACVYIGSSAVGQDAGGVLRFPQAVAVGPDGSVFVGDEGSHVVQVFNPAGTYVGEIGSPGTGPGQLGGVGALAVAGDGSVFVADGSNRVQHFAANGALLNEWGSTGSAVGQFRFGAGHANDAGAGGGLAVGGNTVYVADSGNDRIVRFTLDGGSGTVIVPPGQLANPRGLAVLGTRLAVADDQHHRIVVYDTGGHLLKVVGSGQGAGPGQLNFPYGVALDPFGRLFVADDLNQRVVRFSAAPNYPYVGRWGSYGTAAGQLAFPRGIASDSAGNVYVANTGDDRIDVFNGSGTLLRSFGLSGRASGQFDAPLGVAADSSGIRAVADSADGRIELLNPDGSIATVWGSPNPGPTILPDPVAVAFDAAGNAYVLDQKRGAIVVFDRATGLPTQTIGSSGSGPGQLLQPSALGIDAAGVISVADSGNQRIARFQTDGTYLGPTTGVGTGKGIAVAPDGSRTYLATSNNRITVFGPDGSQLAQFGGTGTKLGKLNVPGQLALDPAGNLWAVDRVNDRVEEFGPDGERLAAFGTKGTALGQFIHPTGVSVDCHGTVTVTDSENNRVEQFALAAPPAVACATLPPLGTPPAPEVPTLPTPLGPQVSVRVLRSTRLLSSQTLPVRVGCDTPCTLTAAGTVAQAGKPRKHHKTVSLPFATATLSLSAGQTKIVRLTLTDKQVKKMNKALGRLRGMTATVQISAVASVGDPTSVTKTLSTTR